MSTMVHVTSDMSVPEALLPEQYFERLTGGAREMPEKRLMAAVLLDALVQLQREGSSGAAEVRAWMTGPGSQCEGSRVVPVNANGMPAFAQWRKTEDGASYYPWAIHVLEVRDGAIVGLNFFLDAGRLFPLYGLPEHPDALAR